MSNSVAGQGNAKVNRLRFIAEIGVWASIILLIAVAVGSGVENVYKISGNVTPMDTLHTLMGIGMYGGVALAAVSVITMLLLRPASSAEAEV